MRKIDDTKKNIGVTHLGEDERKRLFQDLVDAGGKVVSDPYVKPKLVKRTVIDREKQKEYKKLMDERRSSTAKPETAKKALRKNASQSNSQIVPPLNFITNLRLYFRLRFFKICQSDTFLFHEKFIKDLSGAYGTAVFEAKLQYYDIFKKNPEESKRIIAQLNGQNPIFIKLIEIMGELDDLPEINVTEINISELQQPLMETFKTLSLLRPYENTLFNAYFKAIGLYRSKDNKRYSSQQAQKKMIKESLHIIFTKFYPRLHWLMCNYHRCYIRMGDIKTVEKLLDIDPIEKPENIPVVEKVRDLRKIGKQSETDDEETEQSRKENSYVVPDEVQKGLVIMDEYDYDSLRKEFDPKGNFDSIKSNDKALISFLIFNEFIKEFSFILNTNKIKFFSTMGEANYQSKLKDLYYGIDKPRENLKNYSVSSITYNEAEKEKPLSGSQYITYTKRLHEIATKCENDGRSVRIAIKEYMQKLTDEMKILSDDMDGTQTIIQNPQEVLRMDIPIEGKRKLNGKKVFEAVNMCYYFASAFVYRLSARGDLSGELEFSEEELATAKNKDDAGSESNAAEKAGKSIFDELDEFKEEILLSDFK